MQIEGRRKLAMDLVKGAKGEKGERKERERETGKGKSHLGVIATCLKEGPEMMVSSQKIARNRKVCLQQNLQQRPETSRMAQSPSPQGQTVALGAPRRSTMETFSVLVLVILLLLKRHHDQRDLQK